MTSLTTVTRDRSNLVAIVGVMVVAAYFAALSWAVNNWAYDRWMVFVLLPVLAVLGIVIIVSVTSRDEQPLTLLLVLALLAKLGASFVRYYVTFSIYGSGDALRYDEAGTAVADSFHRGDTTVTELLAVGRGTTFMEDLTGIVYTIIGPSDLGGFLFYSWLGFWGLFLFVRAAMVGLPEADHRRYALLVLFLPSLLFWPSSIGKEAVMMFSLGWCAFGAARVLERQRWGWSALGVGIGIGYLLRPHVIVVVLAALTVAMLFRSRPGHQPVFGPVGRIITVAILVVGMAFVLSRAADRLLPASESTGTEAVGELLDRAETGTDEGGSEIDNPRPNNPVEYPSAAFTVLFRPTLLEASSGGNAVAALETTFVLGLFVVGWKRLRNIPTLMFRRPYLLMALVYTSVFAFAWSAFSNLGALARQRVQVWPFLLLVLAIPFVLPSEQRGHSRRSNGRTSFAPGTTATSPSSTAAEQPEDGRPGVTGRRS